MATSPGPITDRPARFYVGTVLIDPGANEVIAGDKVIRLESRSMAVLVFLAQRAGAVAHREDLMSEVWRGRVVTDDSLSRAIAHLRQALGDSGAIETLPKLGYRLRWPVRLADSPAAGGDTPPAFQTITRRPGWLPIASAAAFIALVVVLVMTWPAARGLQAIQIQSVTPVSPVTGIKRMPRFSPDGQMLVFDMQPGDALERGIWVADLPTGTTRQISRGPELDRQADWTRDGTSVVFVRSDATRCDILRKVLASGAEHVIVPCRYSPYVRPRVSPDGRRIVYADLVESGAQAVLYETELDSGRQRQLTQPEPAWSDLHPDYTPDGKHVLFGRASLAAVRDLYLLDLASGDVHKLHHEPGIITDATMESADVFVFATQRTGQMQLIRRDLHGNEQALPIGADYLRAATFSPNRDALVFESWTIRQRIVRAPIGAAASVDISSSSRIDRVPALSPDGTRMAFVSTRDGYANIWLQEMGSERPLTHYRAEDPEFLRWHPSLPWLAFSITRNEGSFACMIDVAAPEPAPRCIEHAGSAAPFWANDGRQFGYAAPDQSGYSIFITASFADVGKPSKLIDDAYFAQPLASGGYCFMRPGRIGIWCQHGGAVIQVNTTQQWFEHKNWLVAGDQVYALQIDGDLDAITPGDEQSRRLGRLPGRMHPNSGLNRNLDGEFVYAPLTTYESELMLAKIASH